MTPNRPFRGMAGNELECARISMMARSISSNTRPDTLVRDHRLHAYDFSLATRGGSIHWGQALSDSPRLRCRCHSRARASLRTRRQGPSIMGFEDRWNNLYRGLAVTVGGSKRTCELTSSIVPRGTSFHRLVELEVSSYRIDSERPHAAAASLVHLNSVPSLQMRCITTAKRRASATIAFFIPRCLAIFIAPGLEPGPPARAYQ
jgi:hypothetical protein